MRSFALLLLPALTAGLLAQSPLTTLFASNTAANAAGGSGVFFNLTVNTSISVTRLDVNLNSAIGASGTIDVWFTPGTHVGNETNPAAWFLLGSGTVMSAGNRNPSPCILNAPFNLTPGTYGIALSHVGLVAAYTTGTGANQVYGNTELTLTAGSSQNVCFSTVAPFTPRVWNGSIYYTVTDPAWAMRTRYGAGCYDRPSTYYEYFLAGTFDLAGTATQTNSIRMTPFNGGYSVVQGSNQWFTPVTANLGLGDDTISIPLVMPFTLNYPGGSTTTVFACSNGFVWLQPNAYPYFRPIVRELLTLGPRLCPLHMDLSPNVGGSVHYDVEPGNGAVHVTWVNVPEYQQTNSQNTMQVTIFSNGSIEYRWRAIANVGWPGLVGWSPGTGVNDPGSIDISASLPFASGNDTRPLTLAASARPILGNTIQLVTGDIPAGTLVGAMVLSFIRHDPGLPLAALGMPGCQQYTGLDATQLLLPTGSIHSQPFALPANPVFNGAHVYCQAVTFSAGFNALGAIASNGLDLRAGTQ